jgi:predicted nucleotidyltransferase
MNENNMKQLREYKTIAEEEKILLMRCCSVIKNIDPSAEVILYGSRARGDAEQESDYDLLILTDEKATLEREDIFRRQLFPIELETGAVLTVFLISREEWNSPLSNAMPFYQNIKRDGVVL